MASIWQRATIGAKLKKRVNLSTYIQDGDSNGETASKGAAFTCIYLYRFLTEQLSPSMLETKGVRIETGYCSLSTGVLMHASIGTSVCIFGLALDAALQGHAVDTDIHTVCRKISGPRWCVLSVLITILFTFNASIYQYNAVGKAFC